jgi:hypothetical protein
MIKAFGPRARSVLLDIFNGILLSKEWVWDKSKIIFLKKPDKDSYLKPGSFRPITISSYIGKIMERLIENRLKQFCFDRDVIDDEQEGFLPQRNTNRYLYKLIGSLKDAQQKKLNAIILCIDLEKAFDSVWIPGLIVKLRRIGVNGPLLHVIDSFLCNRKVALTVNNQSGSHRACGLFGLPQGSVLSPLLFIIFISDMLSFRGNPNCSDLLQSHSNYFKYADDGTITFIHKSLKVCHEIAQEACAEIYSWCQRWKLAINCAKNKTEAIILQHKGKNTINPKSLQNLKIGDKEILFVKKSKVLGVIIDENLDFKNHASIQLRNCWYTWYTLCKNTTTVRGLNQSSLTTLFKSVVLTKLMYAAPIWLQYNLHFFTDFWSRAILKISGSEYHPPRLVAETALGLPPLKLQLNEISLKFVIKNLQDPNFKSIFYQLEETKRHPFHNHIKELQDYITWKRSCTASAKDTRNKNCQIADISEAELYYTRQTIRDYTNHLWTLHVKYSLDPESQIVEEIEDGNLHIQGNTAKHLFPRTSNRWFDSKVISLLHGNSIDFRKFKCTITKKGNPYCTLCGTYDDAYHQLYECTKFSCEYRDLIPAFKDRKTYGLMISMLPGHDHLLNLRKMAERIFDT